jgi:carboxyl-terminal processing protease
MAHRTSRALLTATVFLATCGIVGSIVNQKVAAQSATDESTLRDSLHQFTNVYSLVEQNYADKMNGDKADKAIYDGAIPGMLHTLDPHSNFYDPKAFAQMREDQRGKYYGVGMHIQQQMIDGIVRVVVVAPMEGTPSFRAGLRPGDVIMQIDGKPTDGMDTTGISNKLKGPRGTHVELGVNREGTPKILSFDLMRDEIPVHSVDLAYMIRPGIGYIHLTQFMETSSHEVGDAIDKFEQAGPVNGILLDLRGNPGGLLNEAVGVCDKFLKKGQIVVSQRGRAFDPVTYRASHGSSAKFPIVVLVNRNTASAAEIVSGALQDHDRALIVGETTFGKGLVQTVFTIADNTGLALTTYHYYTPSGRLIQRNYDHVSLYDYYYVRDSATEPKNNANREVKLTDDGRTVYGGGGITPDEKIDFPKQNHFEDEVLIHNGFFNFSKHYLATHQLTKQFTVDDAVMKEWRAFLKTAGVDVTDQDVAANNEWIRANIKGQLFTAIFGETDGMRVRADADPSINKALTYMPEAQALEDHVKPAAKTINTASVSK